MVKGKKDWSLFISSVFFVLGFSVVFSLVGVLFQSVFSSVAYTAQKWLSAIGGLIIILFGIYLLDLLKIPFLEREYKFNIKHKFKSMHLGSFIFGAAFAVGWTPCVGAVLGAVLTLAIVEPTTAFFLMLSYSLGLGIPFLIIGLFANQAQVFIKKSGRWATYIKYFFGVILVVMGLLVLTNNLEKIANMALTIGIFEGINVGVESSLNIGIAFIAGFVTFLSPCVLPLIPAYLSYLAAIGIED